MERSWLALDWLIREYTPTFMELVPALRDKAAELRVLSPVLAPEALDDALIHLREARVASAAARAAAWDAAWAAAWAAAGAAAWAAARVAAGAAAGAAAWDALEPAVIHLQASALNLFDRMLPTEAIQIPVVSDAALVCGVKA
jgi:hypothetical protein